MSDITVDEYFAELRADVAQANHELWDAVSEQCPGPHRPVQHRDAKAPWCNACGRTSDGHQVGGDCDE